MVDKAIFALEKDTSIFSKKDAAIELGIGKNMVSSLRFWVRAAGLVEKIRRIKICGYRGLALL